MHILLIEDHQDIAANITEYFEARGDRVDCAADGLSGLQLAAACGADVIVLDLMLPGLDGISLCAKLRTEQQIRTPVLMLTAKDLLADKVNGFEAGADDYLVKPFSLVELAARLNALVRRSTQSSTKIIDIGGLKFDTNALTAERDGVPIKLNPSMRRILSLLMHHSHRVVTREELEKLLWGDDPPEGDVLRAHMHALRTAIDKGFEQRLLHTIHGTGYRLYVNKEQGE